MTELTTKQAALRYHGAGLAPIALWGLTSAGQCACICKERPECSAAGKHPCRRDWQRYLCTPIELAYEFDRGPRNVGLALGEQPRGDALIALDFDGPFEILHVALRELLGPLPSTLTSVTGRGRHLLYRTPDGVVLGNRAHLLGHPKGDARGDVDVRGHGGQIVAPPSRHVSGHVYRWRSCCEIATLPDSAVEWLSNTESSSKPALPRPAQPRSDGVDDFVLRERAARYLARIPGAVSGSGGHTHTFEVALKLCGLFGQLGEGELWRLFLEFNGTCDPPWSERELRHKLKEAMKATGM